MVTQYVRKKYQMEPTLIPEKRLFLHQGRKVLLPWMSSDTSFGDLTRGSPRHVLAAVEAVEATASRHAAKRLSKVSVLSAPTASRSACLPFSNTPALSVAEGCRERPRHVAQSAPAKVRQIECIVSGGNHCNSCICWKKHKYSTKDSGNSRKCFWFWPPLSCYPHFRVINYSFQNTDKYKDRTHPYVKQLSRSFRK